MSWLTNYKGYGIIDLGERMDKCPICGTQLVQCKGPLGGRNCPKHPGLIYQPEEPTTLHEFIRKNEASFAVTEAQRIIGLDSKAAVEEAERIMGLR